MLAAKTNRRGQQFARARVRRHDQHDVAKIGFASRVVGERRVIHDLQQNVEQIGMRLFDFVEQDDRVWLTPHGIGKQATLIETDVTWRRANQTADRVLFRILAHVIAQQLDTERTREHAREFGLAHARRPEKQKRPDGLVRQTQARARQANRGDDGINRLLLTKDVVAQSRVEFLQTLAFVPRNRLRWNFCHRRNDDLDVASLQNFLSLILRSNTLTRARFIEHINRLVGQIAFVDVFGGEFRRGANRIVRVGYAVMRFEMRFQSEQNLHGLVHRWFEDVNFLKAARETAVAFERFEFLVRRRADASQHAVGERGLEQTRCVHRTATHCACADERVNFVNEQNRVRFVFERFQNSLDAFLELSAIFCAREHQAHVERVDMRVLQQVGHLVCVNSQRETLRHRRLAHAWVADEQGIIFQSPTQDLNRAFEFGFASNQRVELAARRQRNEIGRVLRKWVACRFVLARILAGDFLGWLFVADAVRNVIQHGEPRDALLLQQKSRVRIFFFEQCRENVTALDLLRSRVLRVPHCERQHAPQSNGLLRLDARTSG